MFFSLLVHLLKKIFLSIFDRFLVLFFIVIVIIVGFTVSFFFFFFFLSFWTENFLVKQVGNLVCNNVNRQLTVCCDILGLYTYFLFCTQGRAEHNLVVFGHIDGYKFSNGFVDRFPLIVDVLFF